MFLLIFDRRTISQVIRLSVSQKNKRKSYHSFINIEWYSPLDLRLSFSVLSLPGKGRLQTEGGEGQAEFVPLNLTLFSLNTSRKTNEKCPDYTCPLCYFSIPLTIKTDNCLMFLHRLRVNTTNYKSIRPLSFYLQVLPREVLWFRLWNL